METFKPCPGHRGGHLSNVEFLVVSTLPWSPNLRSQGQKVLFRLFLVLPPQNNALLFIGSQASLSETPGPEAPLRMYITQNATLGSHLKYFNYGLWVGGQSQTQYFIELLPPEEGDGHW